MVSHEAYVCERPPNRTSNNLKLSSLSFVDVEHTNCAFFFYLRPCILNRSYGPVEINIGLGCCYQVIRSYALPAAILMTRIVIYVCVRMSFIAK